MPTNAPAVRTTRDRNGRPSSKPNRRHDETTDGEDEQNEHGRRAQLAVLEHAQRRGRRVLGGRADEPSTRRADILERPRPQRDRERDDRRARGAGRERRGGRRDADRQRSAQHVTEEHRGRFRRIEMSAHRAPHEQRHDAGEHCANPCDEQRDAFRDDRGAERRRRLEREEQRSGLPFSGDESNDDEGKEQRRGEVVGAEGRNDDALERAQSLRQRRRAAGDAAGLGVEVRRRHERVPDQSAHDEQQQPIRPCRGELAEFFLGRARANSVALGEGKKNLLEASALRAGRVRAIRRACPRPRLGRR